MDRLDIRKLPGAAQSTVTDGQGFFPAIAALGGDDLVVVLRGGAGHVGRDGRLDAVRSTDGGQTWSAPITLADSDRDDRNPALGVTADGALLVAYLWQGSYDGDGRYTPSLNRQDTRVVGSTDGGRAWTADRSLDFSSLNGASPYGKIRDVAGVFHMPIYTGSGAMPGEPEPIESRECGVRVEPARSASALLRSTDGGQTWRDPTVVALGLNEADFLPLPDGDWLFAGRSEKGDEQAIHLCRSRDEGRTWQWQGRVTGAMEHPPDLTLLGNGWVLLTFGFRRSPYGVHGLISRDGGRTWAGRLIFADDLPNGDCGYPSTARLASGRLVTVYYAAGLPGEPHDSYSTRGACCRAVVYDEAALIRALES